MAIDWDKEHGSHGLSWAQDSKSADLARCPLRAVEVNGMTGMADAVLEAIFG